MQQQPATHEPTDRRFAVHIGADQVDHFRRICRAIGIGFELGGRVRIRDWRNRTVREGRSFIFRRREDLETVLGYERYLQTHQAIAG